MPKRQFSRSAPAQRRRRSDPARLVAFQVLRAVAEDDAYANLVLPTAIRRAKLDKRDAAFATELTYGALRAEGTYDVILSRCVDRDLAKLDAPVLDALRLGSHQLLGMRVDTHAAVNETVALVRDQIGVGPSGLVNAVLRRVADKPYDQWLETITTDADEVEALSLRHAHPAWVVRAMRQSLRAYGRGAELESLLEADNVAPQVHLIGLPGVGSGQENLASAVEVGAQPSDLIDGAAIFRGGDIGLLDGVRQGSLRVQDIGSQWVTRALAHPAVQEGERWLDLCAGPGGKAALLGSLAAEFEAHLTANEPTPHRSQLVEKALAPIEESAWSVRTGDGRTISELGTTFDRIIVDAPCTGLGALRRRPEARWRRQPSDLAALTALQEELLDAAVHVLAPEGLLAYVTCSPHHAETIVQVQDALRRHSDLRLLDAHEVMSDVALPAGAELLGRRPRTSDEVTDRCVQLWPHIHGTDAMFFALFQKEAP